jgi:hypothetical protein
MSQEICKCSLSDDTCPDCLAQDNEALRINNSVLLDYQNELMERVAGLESALCETCKDPACEDSRLAYYVTKAIKAGERIGRLEKALMDIKEHKCGNCGAQNMADDALEEK